MGDDAAVEMPGRPRIVRRGPGDFELHIPKSHRAILRNLPEELAQVLESGHPSLRRLFPVAYPDDPGASAEFDEMVRADLLEGKRKSLQVMQATVDARRLDCEQLGAWLGALNDLRLFLGTTLEVEEDTFDVALDQSDARGRGLAVYSYLSWLQEQAVEALAADLAN